MPVKKKLKDKFLGELLTHVSGTQYYDAEAAGGEVVILEREPENSHDPNAIRVDNIDFEQVGHVPRKIASWLTPLVDDGKVRANGCIPEGPADSHAPPLAIKLYAAPKGRSILKSEKKPGDGTEALHNIIVSAFKSTKTWDSPEAVEELGQKLSTLSKRDALPETRMLLALFSSQAEKIRRRQSVVFGEQVDALLSSLKIAPGLFHRNLTLFPIVGKNGHKPHYILLEEAIESKAAEVREVSDEGEVPEVSLINRADRPILLPEGEIIIGAKQDRTINITVIVAAKTEFLVPVSCVEQGRWRSRSQHFAASRRWASSRVRAHKSRSAVRSRATMGRAVSDQAEVWDSVSECLSDVEADSDTENLSDAYEAVRDRLGEYHKKIALPKDTIGVIAVLEDRILGIDLFDHPATFSKLWNRLNTAYYFEAAAKNRAKKAKKRVARDFLKSVGAAVRPAARTMGAGTELEVEAQGIAGSAVWHNNRICHLSAFAIEEPR